MVKVISLSNNAYEQLKLRKGERSFSEIVIELVSQKARRKNIVEFAGIWSNKKEGIEKIKKMIEEDRSKFKLREVKI